MPDGQRLLILGSEPFSAEVADVLSEIPGIRVVGFVEHMDRQRCRETLDGLPILWVDELAHLATSHQAICGIPTTGRSGFTDRVAASGMRFATLVHPRARVSSRTSLGEGTLLSVGAVVAAFTTVGRHVLVNRGALVGHHTEIADYVTIGPGANVAGLCSIGEAASIGMGAVIVDRMRIGAHSSIAAGSVVTRDVPERVQVAGAPARVVKGDFAGA